MRRKTRSSWMGAIIGAIILPFIWYIIAVRKCDILFGSYDCSSEGMLIAGKIIVGIFVSVIVGALIGYFISEKRR